jgi:hypothetical protein
MIMKAQAPQQQWQSHPDAQQSIQQRAYELYLKRGQEPGHELEDWVQAEHEVRQRQNQSQNQRAF